ncbi:MAG: phosphopantothenoylcysteine decarboxylase [Oligosphaeraceae bacterium]
MKFTLGNVTVIADGPGVMVHTPPLLLQLQQTGYDVDVAATHSAALFTTPYAPALLTGHPAAHWPLPDDALTANRAVLLAPSSLNAFKALPPAERQRLENSPAGLLVAPALLPDDNPSDALAEWRQLAGDRWLVVPPTAHTPLGALGDILVAPPETCVEWVRRWQTPQDLADKRILITAGPTAEDIDPVRYLTNRSTGRMGGSLARIAARRGAAVTVVHGPLSCPLPDFPNITPVPVRSAQQMFDAVDDHLNDCDVAILCAAVADYAPASYSELKLKKSDKPHTLWDMPDALPLRRTPDILAHLGALSPRPFLVGFAAESDHIEENARLKLMRKGCDLLCANDITEPGSGFAVKTNRVTVFTRTGDIHRLPQLDKDDVARKILDLVAEALG